MPADPNTPAAEVVERARRFLDELEAWQAATVFFQPIIDLLDPPGLINGRLFTEEKMQGGGGLRVLWDAYKVRAYAVVFRDDYNRSVLLTADLAVPPTPRAEMVVVPREPTPEMVKAGQRAADDKRWAWCGYGPRKEGEGLDGMAFYIREAYRAMLPAAPARAAPLTPRADGAVEAMLERLEAVERYRMTAHRDRLGELCVQERGDPSGEWVRYDEVIAALPRPAPEVAPDAEDHSPSPEQMSEWIDAELAEAKRGRLAREVKEALMNARSFVSFHAGDSSADATLGQIDALLTSDLLTTLPTPPDDTARLREEASELAAHWVDFCDADPVPEGFIERMEAAGLVEFGAATVEEAEALNAGAWDGMKKGSGIYRLSTTGRAALTPGSTSP